MRCVELYAGAGGLALGVGLAGFEPLAVVEWDSWACDTLRENQRRGYPLVAGWPIHQGDVRTFDWSRIPQDIELLAGGPPCQPFSMGGKHKAHDDSRDMFPATVEIVRKLRPKAFIVENVKGLTRSTFANYYQHILLQLEYPEIVRRRNETWFDHLMRLQKHKTSNRRSGLTYRVVPTLVNAADYGIPQKRERVFIVGFRSDIGGGDWSFPAATHSQERLFYEQYVSGEYWSRHRTNNSSPFKMTDAIASRIRRLIGEPPSGKAWRTVRDALVGLPDPRSETAAAHRNHGFQDGARIYPGHTGSPLDAPAKTLKAGDHGVPGGENMMVRADGSVRYFSIRESARIQTFPDGFVFHGSWTETMRQLGNAVPVSLGRIVAASVAEKLVSAEAERVLHAQANQRRIA